jgi:SAM-dependent methyltransferase
LKYNAKEYWNKLLDASFDEAGVCWPKWPRSYNRYLHRQQKDGLEKILQEHSISLEGKAVCEVGPGSGFWTGLFKIANVSSYKGFDITKNSIDTLAVKYPSFDFKECDFSEYTPSSSEIERFDITISVLVFLHITDNVKFEACINNMGQMLKKDGYVIVLDAVSKHPLKGRQRKMADGAEFDVSYHNKVRYLDYYILTAKSNNMELVGSYPAFNITQNSFDFKTDIGHKIGTWYFNKILNPLLMKASERQGEFIGKLLVVVDKYLFCNVGSSSKWLVFRKSK